MKKYFLLFAVLFFLSHLAQADSGCKWRGFYVGANAGAAFGHAHAKFRAEAGTFFGPENLDAVNAKGSSRFCTSGFTGGIQAGYLYPCCRYVLGAEADFGAFWLAKRRDAHGHYVIPPTISFIIHQSTTTDWLFTLRPKVGWTWCRYMFYGAGGLALTDLKHVGVYSDVTGAFERSSIKKTQVGWTVGGGIEKRCGGRLRAKLEYLYLDFGRASKNSTLALTPGSVLLTAPFHRFIDLNAHVVRVGLNYRI